VRGLVVRGADYWQGHDQPPACPPVEIRRDGHEVRQNHGSQNNEAEMRRLQATTLIPVRQSARPDLSKVDVSLRDTNRSRRGVSGLLSLAGRLNADSSDVGSWSSSPAYWTSSFCLPNLSAHCHVKPQCRALNRKHRCCRSCGVSVLRKSGCAQTGHSPWVDSAGRLPARLTVSGGARPSLSTNLSERLV